MLHVMGFDAEGLLVQHPDLGSLTYTCKSLSNTQDALDLHLHLGHLADTFMKSHLQYVHLSEEREAIYGCQYSNNAHRIRYQAFTIVMLPFQS